jgi:hypothetical protein
LARSFPVTGRVLAGKAERATLVDGDIDGLEIASDVGGLRGKVKIGLTAEHLDWGTSFGEGGNSGSPAAFFTDQEVRV